MYTKSNRVHFIFCVLFLELCTFPAHAQKLWKRYIVVYKTFYTGGNVPRFVEHIDKTKALGVYGLFDSAHIYSTTTGQVIQRTPHLYNTLEYTGSTWQSAGDAVFYVSDRSSVFFHNKLFGDDYIMCTGEEPYFRKRNTVTNAYEAVGNLHFSVYDGVLFNEWGSKVLLLGYYTLPNAISNLCLWDMQHDTYQKIGGGTLGYDFLGPKEAVLSPTDSTLAFLCYKTEDAANGLRVLLYKDTIWANGNGQYPPLPDNNTHIAIADKNHIWVSTQSSDATNQVSEVYALDKAHNTWNKIVTFKKNNIFLTPTVTSMVYGNGNVYVAGDFDSANGTAHTGVIAYNTGTKTITEPATNNGLLSDYGGCGGNVYLYYENTNLYAYSTGCAIFGEASIYVLTNNGVLPITLQSFTGMHLQNGNQLAWKLPPAQPIASFLLERSHDGKTFDALTTIAGTGMQSYSYLDRESFEGDNYYRLQLKTADGATSYSKIVKVYAGRQYIVSLYPSPAQNAVTIQTMEPWRMINMINSAGRVVKQVSNTGSNQFSIADLPTGYYMVQVLFADNSVFAKLLKQ